MQVLKRVHPDNILFLGLLPCFLLNFNVAKCHVNEMVSHILDWYWGNSLFWWLVDRRFFGDIYLNFSRSILNRNLVLTPAPIKVAVNTVQFNLAQRGEIKRVLRLSHFLQTFTMLDCWFPDQPIVQLQQILFFQCLPGLINNVFRRFLLMIL